MHKQLTSEKWGEITRKRLCLINTGTKFGNGNNEALLGVIRNTGYLRLKLIGIYYIWGEINGMQDI